MNTQKNKHPNMQDALNEFSRWVDASQYDVHCAAVNFLKTIGDYSEGDCTDEELAALDALKRAVEKSRPRIAQASFTVKGAQ
jgi:hypothetical protein